MYSELYKITTKSKSEIKSLIVVPACKSELEDIQYRLDLNVSHACITNYNIEKLDPDLINAKEVLKHIRIKDLINFIDNYENCDLRVIQNMEFIITRTFINEGEPKVTCTDDYIKVFRDITEMREYFKLLDDKTSNGEYDSYKIESINLESTPISEIIEYMTFSEFAKLVKGLINTLPKHDV